MQQPVDFLSRGGEMARLMREFDWSATPLGDPALWPETLKTTLRLMLTSHHPMFIWWGPELTQFYNDAYRRTMGPERHPSALGQRGYECWSEVWDIIGPQIASIMDGGEATWHVEQLVPTTRNGRIENIWWTYGYSPIADSNGVQGVLVVCNDVTVEHQAKLDLQRVNEELLIQIHACERLEATQAFQVQLLETLGHISEPGEIASVVFEMVGQHLNLSRITFSAINEQAQFVVEHAWNRSGIENNQYLTGYDFDYSVEMLPALQEGKVVTVSNITSDPRTKSGAFGLLGARAVMAVPIRQNDTLVACLSSYRAEPHEWTANEVSIFKDVAERVYNAIERKKIQAFRAASREKLYERQREESQRLNALFQQTPSFMAVLRGPEHVYEMVNASTLRLLGDREFVGLPIRAALPELEGQGYFELLDQVYKTGKPFIGLGMPAQVARTSSAALEQRFINFIFQPIIEKDGSISGIFVEGSDVTEQHLTSLELKRVNGELAEKIRELELADRRKNEFLAMLAHELRNPLSPISAASELLRLGTLPVDGVKRTSEIISRQIKHMTGLIDDLMDVSRVTRGLVVLNKTKIDLQHLVLEALEQMRPMLERHHHRLSIKMLGDSVYVVGDEKRLIQAVANVLNNAAKYTPNGGHIQLELQIENNQVGVIISDNGIGMDEDTARDAFELFTQAERSSDRTLGGLGIGLALVKSIIELHDGHVEGQSDGPGKGSRFSLWLPVASAPFMAGVQSSSAALMSSTPLRILVVDDNVDAAQVLAMYLDALGHTVDVAHVALDALALASQQTFDVALLDIGLPGMDGYELAQQLRMRPATANVILIAITGYGQEKDKEKARDAGFNHHLVKPVDTAYLLGLLNDIKK